DVLDPAKVSEAERRQVRAALGIPADALLVTLVSRVIRSKGVEEFVAAARGVRQRLPGARFLLVGAADRESLDGCSPAERCECPRSARSRRHAPSGPHRPPRPADPRRRGGARAPSSAAWTSSSPPAPWRWPVP